MIKLFTFLSAMLSLGAVFVGHSSSAANETVDAAELRRAFYSTVFGLEYGADHPDAHRVKRYTGTVAFHVDDRSRADRLAAAHHFLGSLPQRIAHLKAVRVLRPESADFRVILVRQSDFATTVARELRADARAMNARCLVGVSTEGGRIRRSTAVIVADDDYLFSRCLVEEVLQGLGPMNDDASLSLSVFNDRSRLSHFTAFDEALLNVLYHPLVRPGMTGTEVGRVLPQVFRELGYAD